ncbi:MAG: replication and repair protein RecF [Pedosphaera sp.]|nr:replication and repair protein RecF [Pedosphaera sp.]
MKTNGFGEQMSPGADFGLSSGLAGTGGVLPDGSPTPPLYGRRDAYHYFGGASAAAKASGVAGAMARQVPHGSWRTATQGTKIAKGWFCTDYRAGMHLAHLRLRDFRNYPRLDVDFAPGFQVLLGDNAQGKTNILEAIYLMATLRSFRGVGGAQMVRHGQKGYFAGGKVVGQGEREIKMYWSAAERKLSVDGQPVRKLTDYLGVLRVVIFCTEDLQLVKGTARSRRRFVDLLLTQTHPLYLGWLQRYAQALRSRNALLKQRSPDEAALDSFSGELVKLGNEIIRMRRELAPKLSPLARLAYRRISNDAEELRVEYQSSVKSDFAVELAQSRARERTMRTTLVGPHRDEVRLLLNDRSAAQFGSEGQKRTLAIALKMAQAEYLTGIHGSPPILLIDDVMGELDVKRRSGFLPLLERAQHARGQVFMTCTEENWPRELGRELQRWEVKGGAIKKI